MVQTIQEKVMSKTFDKSKIENTYKVKHDHKWWKRRANKGVKQYLKDTENDLEGGIFKKMVLVPSYLIKGWKEWHSGKATLDGFKKKRKHQWYLKDI